MTTDHGGNPDLLHLERTYIHLKRAWHAATNLDGAQYVDEITFQVHDGGFLLGEFLIQWVVLATSKKPVPRLCAFDDGWRAMVILFSDLLETLAEEDGGCIQPEALCKLLDELGITDATPVVQP